MPKGNRQRADEQAQAQAADEIEEKVVDNTMKGPAVGGFMGGQLQGPRRYNGNPLDMPLRVWELELRAYVAAVLPGAEDAIRKQYLVETMIRYLTGKAAVFYTDEILMENEDLSYNQVVQNLKEKFEGEKSQRMHYQELITTFNMRKNERIEDFKTRFGNKLILSGRDKTNEMYATSLQKDQVIWFKKALNDSWKKECSARGIRTLENWKELAEELVNIAKENEVNNQERTQGKMLYLWEKWTHCKRLLEKQGREKRTTQKG
jgi:hypothetical protein